MENKKNILFFTENLVGGGVERILQIICKNFDIEKYDIVLYTVRKQQLPEPFLTLNFRYGFVFDGESNNSFLNLIYKIKNKIKLWCYYHCSPELFYKLFIREHTDVAIAFIEGYATRIVSGFPYNTKKITWLHTDIINNHWSAIAFRANKSERQSYKKFDKVVCVSKIVQSQYEKYVGNYHNSMILYNPIDTVEINRKALTPIFIPRKDGVINITTLGSLIPVKGYERLLKVFARLREFRSNIELHIYGSGSMEAYLKSLISKLHINESAFVEGYKINPYPYLKAADIYVCSSFAEGYNTAITEALILGKPVVSTECSGVKEQLGENNEWGICCENSEEGLYNGLKLMLDGDNIFIYGNKANIRGSKFSLNESMNQIYKLLEL